MKDIKFVDLTPENIADYGVCGYKNLKKHVEIRNKIEWFEKYYPKELRIKVLFSKKNGYQGMIEYLPGEFAHRPVQAKGYMFIQCMFIGFKKEFKKQGFASQLIEQCINEAKEQNMLGVAVVTRKGSFMAGKDIFLKKDFEMVDSAKPDFNLLIKKFDKSAENPKFILNDSMKFDEGLTIIRSVQCPYTEKNVKAILETAKTEYGVKTKLIDANDHKLAQNTPSPFGTFCMIYNGKIVSYHPISNGRFKNIMNKINDS